MCGLQAQRAPDHLEAQRQGNRDFLRDFKREFKREFEVVVRYVKNKKNNPPSLGYVALGWNVVFDFFEHLLFVGAGGATTEIKNHWRSCKQTNRVFD